MTKILQRLKTQEAVPESTADQLIRRRGRSQAVEGASFGIVVDGVADDAEVLVRMARCCTPVPGDEITGYISVGRGITIHRTDCPNARALMRNPERFTPVEWDGEARQSFRVTVAVDSWDRTRLLEDVGRTFAENGTNVVEYGGARAGGHGAQLVRDRDHRRAHAARGPVRPPADRVGVRRVPGHADGAMILRAALEASVWTTVPSGRHVG